MSAQTRDLLKAISQASAVASSFESSRSYLTLLTERATDPVVASAMFAAFLISQNKPFTIRLTSPITSGPESPLPIGPKIILGSTDEGGPESDRLVEISHHTSNPSTSKVTPVLNPTVYGLNGSQVGSTAVMTYIMLKELGFVQQQLSVASIAAALTVQPEADIQSLKGLNNEVATELLERGAIVQMEGLKAPVAENLPLHHSLQAMLEPFVPGISGDERGSASLVQQLIRRSQLGKSAGIVTGTDARILFDEFQKIRTRAGFKEIKEDSLIGTIALDSSRPVDNILRNVKGLALALEACASMGEYSTIYRLLLGDASSTYPQIKKVVNTYCQQVSAGVRQTIQAQEYFRETQNAIYVLKPPAVTPETVFRVAKSLTDHSSTHDKPVFIMVPLERSSYVVGYLKPEHRPSLDLGKVMFEVAQRFDAKGSGNSFSAHAAVSPEKIEAFLDDLDVQVGSA
ncbi:MAG: hypothetical protein M1357_01125 [Candidatus Marsarchaeota archaeon]|nr:hypothetical protein [Candidatus Marsarchaeota archaeon]